MDIRDHCACLYQKEELATFPTQHLFYPSSSRFLFSSTSFTFNCSCTLLCHIILSFFSFLSTFFFRLAIFSSNFFLFCNLKEKTIMAAIYVNFFFTLNEFVLYFVNANIGKSLAVYGFLCKSLRYILLALCFAVKNQYNQHIQWTL